MAIETRHRDFDAPPIDRKAWSDPHASDAFTVNRDRTQASYTPPAPPHSDEVTFDENPINWKEWSESNDSAFEVNKARADSGATDPLVSAFWD